MVFFSRRRLLSKPVLRTSWDLLGIPLIFMLGLVVAPQLAAQERESRWSTALGEGVLTRCSWLIVGRVVESAVAGPRVVVVRFRVERTLWTAGGAAALPQELSLVDDQASHLQRDQRLLVALRRLSASWRIVEHIDLGGKDAAARLGMLDRQLAVEAQTDPHRRAAQHRELILEGLANEDVNVHIAAMAELEKYLLDRKGSLEADFRLLLSRLSFSLTDEARAQALRGLLSQLPPPIVPSLGHEPKIQSQEVLSANDALARLAAERDPTGRLHAMIGLREWPAPATVEKLCEMVGNGPLPERRLAAFLLGELGAQQATTVLAAAAEDKDLELARWCLRSLGMLGGADALRVLTAATGRAEIADEAVRGLWRMGSAEADAALEQLADSGTTSTAVAQLARYYRALRSR
jgi:hypothetical protein